MAQDIRRSREEDRAAVHHFIRLVGRAPTDEELAEFQSGATTRSRRASLRSLRLRYRAARLIVRL
jgi:hypothetical protein